jgi:protein O-mannosyl-transferase
MAQSLMPVSWRWPVLVFAVAVALYLPTGRYGFVEDDRAVILANPRAHSVPQALGAFDQPYWSGQYYRPLTILTYAVDWSVSGGRPGWLHLANALWHGLASVLVVLVLARALSPAAAAAGGLVFALHPVHAEAVAGLVGRAEVLAAVGMLGAVLCARRGWWGATVACAAAAMLSKEHGVATGVLIVLDHWLRRPDEPSYPRRLYATLGIVTAGFLVAWYLISRGAFEVAPVLLDAKAAQRLAIALPAALRAAGLLAWPAQLSADYGPQVIPVYSGFSLAALGGVLIVASTLVGGWRVKRTAPVLTFAAWASAAAYLPTSNLLFPSGIVLAERALYLPVLLVAALVGWAVQWAWSRWTPRRVGIVAAALFLVLAGRTLARLPVWRDNRTFLLTLLAEHPESYWAHWSAAAVLAGVGDTAAARREYARADSLFDGDPHLDAARALFLVGLSDTAGARPLVDRARRRLPFEAVAMRAQLLLLLRRGQRAGAVALADTAGTQVPWEASWYYAQLR